MTKKIKNIIIIQIAFFIYSLASVFSKNAGISSEPWMFLIFYGCSFLCLGIYAIIWQHILKNNSLIFAYLNKGITLLWGLVFGLIIFNEKIQWNMFLGIFIVIAGIIIANTGEEGK